LSGSRAHQGIDAGSEYYTYACKGG
jgi:hypothetical protein